MNNSPTYKGTTASSNLNLQANKSYSIYNSANENSNAAVEKDENKKGKLIPNVRNNTNETNTNMSSNNMISNNNMSNTNTGMPATQKLFDAT